MDEYGQDEPLSHEDDASHEDPHDDPDAYLDDIPYVEITGDQQIIEGPAERWSTEWQHTIYVQATDGVIGRMDGTIPSRRTLIYVPEEKGTFRSERRDLDPPQSVIYLDKSARPVSWLVRAMWDELARTPGTRYEDREIPEKPQSYYLNIDKTDWLLRMGVPIKDLEDPPAEMIDFRRIPREHLARIRAIFSEHHIDEDNLDEAWDHPTKLDGQHVMIVDEVASSGRTLEISQKLLSLAIPEATFSGVYWAQPKRVPLNNGVPVDGAIQFRREWVPVWYHGERTSGRGIGEKNPGWQGLASEQGQTLTRLSRIGRFVLSTPPHDPSTNEPMPDRMAQRIQKEVKKMARELRAGRIFYIPSIDRLSESTDGPGGAIDRIETINKMGFEEWRTKRDELAASH